jgi:hypothetical protein
MRELILIVNLIKILMIPGIYIYLCVNYIFNLQVE